MRIPLALAVTAVLTACQAPQPPAKPVYGTTNPSPQSAANAPVKYYASIIELKPEKEQEYRKLHADTWPDVIAGIRKSKIRNFQVFLTELGGKKYLVSHFEYYGNNPAKDFAAMSNDPTTRDKWWPLTDACQIRLPGTPKGQQWRAMEMLCRIE